MAIDAETLEVKFGDDVKAQDLTSLNTLFFATRGIALPY